MTRSSTTQKFLNSPHIRIWTSRDYLTQFIPTVLVLIFALNRISLFMVNYVERRPGAVLHDPLLARFDAIDMTWLAFGLIYGGLVFGIGHLYYHPKRLILAIHAYTVMITFRAIAMYFLPLAPPEGMIPLTDPMVEFLGSDGVTLTKDLFFSGHTSTMFILYVASVSTRIRTLFLLSTFGVAACVLIQKVHYSIDVFAAPFFAYGSLRVVGLMHAILHRYVEAKRSR